MNKITLVLLGLFFLFVPNLALAGNDPACFGKNQDLCDGLGMMLLAKGKGCYRMYEVTPLSPNGGGDRYRIKCQITSTSSDKVSYFLEFGPGNSSYEVR
ncbi:MAG: hypothetical protein OEY01_16065 [Desulfobulbaceae bacterium]|nr:hypothetical protein [Desulfobulbaceae bacterium]HIJ80009.1 hypothetical protein [Deltaproteobacteria bacterium]